MPFAVWSIILNGYWLQRIPKATLQGWPGGLSYEADLPDISAGRDCHKLVRTGRIMRSGKGFHCMEDDFRHDGSAVVRRLLPVRLTEVSPVAVPGYLTTSAAVRSLAPPGWRRP
ncbi:HK97 family phage prohead protease [Mycobacterium szulgai]|uniref:HK97 family phage prohead protease n=1 Tax=Mycobacterium szulgai TaxID=1787 RepID=UPI000A1F910B|nr:HK97 family phage prohead protease [Mycobacterium szulgai]